MFKFWFELFGFTLAHGFAFWDASTAVGVGASVIGGLSSSDSASAAADAQTQAASNATAETRRQYDQTRADLAPGRALYTGASNKLANYLGLDSGGNTTGGTPATAAFTPLNYQDWANQQTSQQAPSDPYRSPIENLVINRNQANSSQASYQQYLNSHPATNGTAATTGTHDANYGSLLNPFTQNDLNNDPVYQNGLKFGLDQGIGAINARAMANGSSDSGSALKELTRYGNDYGSTKANDSFNRFGVQKNRIYDYLSGAASTGGSSANATVQAGQNASNNISSNILSAGNARSAGITAGNNSFQNTLSNLIKQIPSQTGSYNGSYGGSNASPGIIWN